MIGYLVFQFCPTVAIAGAAGRARPDAFEAEHKRRFRFALGVGPETDAEGPQLASLFYFREDAGVNDRTFSKA